MKWVMNWVVEGEGFTTEAQRARRMDDFIQTVANHAGLEWQQVTKVVHYYLSVNAMNRPMQVRESDARYRRTQ